MRYYLAVILTVLIGFIPVASASDDPFLPLKEAFETEKNDLFTSFAADVDSVLAEERLTDSTVVNELVNEHLLVFAADIAALRDRYDQKVMVGEFGDSSFWEKYSRFSLEVLLRRVQTALFLAVGADAELEKMRQLLPALEVINYQMDYSRERLAATRKSLVHFDAQFACYCSSCNTR